MHYRRHIMILAGALVLALAVVRSGFATALSGINPSLAVEISSSNGTALAAFAQMRLLTAQGAAEIKCVREISVRALVASPLQSSALRNIGFIEDGSGGGAKARALISIGSKISRRDAMAQSWLFAKYVQGGQAAAAVDAADIVMRQNAETWPTIVNELVGLSADPRIVVPIVRALIVKPDWRGSYLQSLGHDGLDLNASYRIFESLKSTSAPPRSEELVPFFARFDGSEMPDRLWRYWQKLSPDRQSGKLIRDGGFEGVDAPQPFNWSLYQSDDVYAQLLPKPGRAGRALYLSYGSGKLANFTHQMLALKPGRYVLGFSSYAESVAGVTRPFSVTVGCGGKNVSLPIARLTISMVIGSWVSNKLPIVVPDGCIVQQLWISGLPLAYGLESTVWLDDFGVIAE